MRLFLLFCLINVSVFSQREKQTVFIQSSIGNTFYVDPTIKTNLISPTAEIIFIANLSKNDSSKITFFSLAGFSHTNTTQTLNNQVVLIDNSYQQIGSGKLDVTEFALSLGGGLRYNISKKTFLNFGIAGQIGLNYLGEINPRIADELYQFYILSKVQLGIKINKRISFIAALSSRFFICQNEVSEPMPNKFYNYAPVKLTGNIGLQVGLFK